MFSGSRNLANFAAVRFAGSMAQALVVCLRRGFRIGCVSAWPADLRAGAGIHDQRGTDHGQAKYARTAIQRWTKVWCRVLVRKSQLKPALDFISVQLAHDDEVKRQEHDHGNAAGERKQAGLVMTSS